MCIRDRNMYSNRFAIAEGHSSAKVNCDLKKHKYNLKLGILDVNSDIIATTLLTLPREISGKASGLIELNTCLLYTSGCCPANVNIYPNTA